MHTIYGPRATNLRNQLSEQERIAFMMLFGTTAMIIFDTIRFLILDWCDDGGLIATADGRVIDMVRAERDSETVVYDIDGNQVFLEPGIPLLTVEEAYGASPRRTINHMRAKRGKPSSASR